MVSHIGENHSKEHWIVAHEEEDQADKYKHVNGVLKYICCPKFCNLISSGQSCPSQVTWLMDVESLAPSQNPVK